jgi:hypothetical protein
MKNITKIFAIALVALGFASTSYGQVSATASTEATIITPIAITKDVDMNFGNVAVSPTLAGTVVMTPASARTKTGGVTLPTVFGTVSAAKFTVTGTAGSTYTIGLPGTITLTKAGGGATMTVGTWTSTPTPTGTLTGGTEEVFVGATLNVAAAQAAGVYTNAADLAITVNYN